MQRIELRQLRLWVTGACMALLLTPAAMGQTPVASVGIEQLDDMAQSGAADSLANMIESALGATGRFRVVERAQLARLMETPPPVRSRRGRPAPAAPSIPPVDYLIQGTITA